ncbi:DNA-binding NtrC family response regulator [Pseudoduganella lurida]|uniref:DNA-binding NtrC family response regulator n=1 Tax=Pseudoduganella lurida TaxID=1036180 RepID=A0A562RKP0_9BURK|nr:sigma-54 dependent transcriptional regulator [Pseudoduganella lurida]TWI69615.1 DNA-binding NtrC family response regulator [Pseudoduganella lurida]
MTIKKLLWIAGEDRQTDDRLRTAAAPFGACVAGDLAGARDLAAGGTMPVGVVVLGGMAGGVEPLDHFLREHCWMKWVALCDPAALQEPRCRKLIHEHCIDFHTLPVDALRLRHTLGHAHGVAALHDLPPPRAATQAMRLTGYSAPVVQLRQQVQKVAAATAPVLIWGESGTGKELVARAVHEGSARAAGPFVPINCAAIPAGLVQSELFGHERGAFTGAARARVGLLESAAGGSVFLDEIGDLPLDMQANLLRFLQEKTIHRLGGTRPVQVDARVIAASHVKLQEAVARGTFREDLYYRLNVLSLEVPALRERSEDVLVLAEAFFHDNARERSAQVKGFSGRALQALRAHHWPGNVRELLNRVRRASVMAEGRLITPHDLGLDDVLQTLAPPLALNGARVQAERRAIEAGLGAGKSITLVARELGVSRMTLYRLMAKHSIAVPARKRSS